jgi:hypothetical protein
MSELPETLTGIAVAQLRASVLRDERGSPCGFAGRSVRQGG